tara:strand:- start:385 stop:540 length:156 start_codon:yes stop_codon:yes gene_type:complete
MTLLDVGLLFIFVSNVWVLYVVRKIWYSTTTKVNIPVSVDSKGNIKIEEIE